MTKVIDGLKLCGYYYDIVGKRYEQSLQYIELIKRRSQ